MGDWLTRLFDGDMTDMSRVNFWGIGLMLLGLLLSLLSEKVAAKTRFSAIAVKLAGVAIVAIGALIAVKFIG